MRMRPTAEADDSRSFLVWTLIVHILGTVAVAIGSFASLYGPGVVVLLVPIALALLAGGHLRRKFLEPLIPPPGGFMSQFWQGNLPVIRAFEARLMQAGEETGLGARRLLWLSRGWLGVIAVYWAVLTWINPQWGS